ncbi:MAG: ATP-binding protein, partial [Gemmatimonadales bacterium]
QVLMNLVVNARDAMPRGGKLLIETTNVVLDEEYARLHLDVAPGEYVMLSVSDSGTGMTEEVKARIFEPFFTTKEEGRGSGLGLATCYGIVREFGGHIAAYSEIGVGTTMKVYLPRVAHDRPAKGSATQRSLSWGDETILLVEDDESVRRVTARVLRRQGYTVMEAGDAEEAMALLESHASRVDLLLTDVVLPGASGRAVAEMADVVSPGIKILFASGYTEDAILRHRLRDEGVNLLQKPFTIESLSEKVRKVLDGDA